ncbi:hypothetical protein HPB50_007580 [Hyalomma asiaticum]|uniref:Uncharacterized protein n=1 Tax=Hyalomma asiaticum TaxID=266040 RepID=A0ACB7S7E4_HYAAI|nr:hypothetical protein HPB50_007580 [Hyalomma asiaticum]
MQNRFATTDGDAFRLFIHYRLKGGQTTREYYEEKKRLGSLADLKECRIISGLTDGVPPDVELALAGLSFQTSSEWLAAAERVETSLRRVRGVSFARNIQLGICGGSVGCPAIAGKATASTEPIERPRIPTAQGVSPVHIPPSSRHVDSQPPELRLHQPFGLTATPG